MNFYKKFQKNPNKKIIGETFNKEMKAINKSILFPQAKEVLKHLKKKKINMIILSSYLQESLEKEIKDNKIENYFLNINGGVNDKIKSIKSIMQKNNFKPEETIFVGDMTHDIEAGRKANIKTVAFSQGYQFKEDLSKSNPDFLIDSLDELNLLLT